MTEPLHGFDADGAKRIVDAVRQLERTPTIYHDRRGRRIPRSIGGEPTISITPDVCSIELHAICLDGEDVQVKPVVFDFAQVVIGSISFLALTECPSFEAVEPPPSCNTPCYDCDHDDARPDDLCATFTDCTGDYACLEGQSFDITWNEPSSKWFSGYGVSAGCGTCEIQLLFYCLETEHWYLDFSILNPMGLPCGGGIYESVSEQCDPFQAVFEITVGAGSCTCMDNSTGGTFTVTVVDGTCS